MLKGLPGSGKSTRAKQFVQENRDYVRINKDTLRDMMGNYCQGKDEQLVLDWRDLIIARSLRKGKGVVVDDTNFHPKHEIRLRELVEIENSQRASDFVAFEEFFIDTPLSECIKNDLNRPISVGEKVIKKMWRQYLAPKYEKPPYNPSLPDVIICDLDGTLAIHNGRSPYEMVKCNTDLFNNIVVEMISDWHARGHRIIFVTGREETYRTLTLTWLDQRFPRWLLEALYMRPTGDFREDSIIKQEIYDREIKEKYNVEFILDDRDRVVDMWRRNGLTCFQVADGDF